MVQKLKQKLKQLALKGLPLIMASTIAFGGAVGLAGKKFDELKDEQESLSAQVDDLVSQIEAEEKENASLKEKNEELTNGIEEVRAFQNLKNATEKTFNGYTKVTSLNQTTKTTYYSNNLDTVFYERTNKDNGKQQRTVYLNNKGVVESAKDNGDYYQGEKETLAIAKADEALYNKLTTETLSLKTFTQEVREKEVKLGNKTFANKSNVDTYIFDIVENKKNDIGDVKVVITNGKIESITYDYTNSYQATYNFESVSKREFLEEQDWVTKYINAQKFESTVGVN